MSGLSFDSIPVVFTPTGGWSQWPGPILAGCIEPLPEEAPVLDGFWQVGVVLVGGEPVANHPALGHISRIEQAGDRIVITGGGIIHDMRCDGTLEHGVHDVAEFDKTTPVHVVATYENGVHVLRPDGLDIEVKRWREGDELVWEYLGFTARMHRLADSDTDGATLGV